MHGPGVGQVNLLVLFLFAFLLVKTRTFNLTNGKAEVYSGYLGPGPYSRAARKCWLCGYEIEAVQKLTHLFKAGTN